MPSWNVYGGSKFPFSIFEFEIEKMKCILSNVIVLMSAKSVDNIMVLKHVA